MKRVPAHVEDLRELLGVDAVLLSCPLGSKVIRRPWRKLTRDCMTPDYLERLAKRNIGVALGNVSGALCCIDIDDDNLVQPFAELNHALEGTLQTRGARGRVYWVRFLGAYPQRTVKLRTVSRMNVGEFRSNCAYSLVSGIHPDTKLPYQFVVRAKVLEIDFASINWPDTIANPPQINSAAEECTEAIEAIDAIDAIDATKAVGGVGVVRFSSMKEAVEYCLPAKFHENHDRLFDLARAVLTLEQSMGKFTVPMLKEIFELWYIGAGPFLRPEQSKEDYWIEYLTARQRAKYPFGGHALEAARAKAHSEPLPAEAMQFEDPRKRLLVALCRQLQIANGPNPFFLSSYSCKEVFGAKSHTSFHNWLLAFEALGILKTVKKGNRSRATRYFYLGTL